MIAVLAAFLLHRAWRARSDWRTLAGHGGGLVAVATLLLAPVVVPMAAQISAAGSAEEASRTGHDLVDSADLVAYFVPDHTMARWWGWSLSEAASGARTRIDQSLHGSRFERSTFPGYLGWIAAAVVLSHGGLRRRYAPFAALAFAFLAVGLGPTLHVAGRPVAAGWLPAALLEGVPILGMWQRDPLLRARDAGIAMLVTGVVAYWQGAAGTRRGARHRDRRRLVRAVRVRAPPGRPLPF